jgi:hypothetical protein
LWSPDALLKISNTINTHTHAHLLPQPVRQAHYAPIHPIRGGYGRMGHAVNGRSSQGSWTSSYHALRMCPSKFFTVALSPRPFDFCKMPFCVSTLTPPTYVLEPNKLSDNRVMGDQVTLGTRLSQSWTNSLISSTINTHTLLHYPYGTTVQYRTYSGYSTADSLSKVFSCCVYVHMWCKYYRKMGMEYIKSKRALKEQFSCANE